MFGKISISLLLASLLVASGGAQAQDVASGVIEFSPTEPYPIREVYYPGTEALAEDEMRVIACGTGMPQPRLKQAAACFLVELGNGDKFIFDMGYGSFERLTALGIPMDFLGNVFLGHLHLDHAGDFPQYYFTKGINSGRSKTRLFGPNGVKPEWGTKTWFRKIREAWAWEEASRGGAVDQRGLEIEITEFDWTAENAVIYDENGVQVRTIPAVHADQSVSFILEWNGLKFAYSSDTSPNRWWVKHTQDADISIHEVVLPPEMWVTKYYLDSVGAVMASTQAHTPPQAFGKVMAMTKPRMAVAYHFQNDADTAPVVLEGIREIYDGPLSLATDFMTWNITSDEIRVRMAAPNHERFPEPPQREFVPNRDAKPYEWTETTFDGYQPEIAAVINKLVDAFNEEFGTDVKPTTTAPRE
ncbi:MAG: guanitoxin biosynthesis MBL fold metallo-hydrolase GntH [bacterium]